MKNFFTSAYFISSLALCSQTPFWNPLGPDDFNQATGSSFSIAPNGVPYIASIQDNLTVKMFSNNSWKVVGTSGIGLQSVTDPAIAFDNNSVPYVVFKDNGNSNYGLTVKKFNGTVWQNVGAPNIGGPHSNNTAIALDGNNLPVILFRDGTTSNNRCMRYNGSVWAEVGPVNTFTTGSNWNQIAVAPNGDVLVKYENIIARFNGTSWNNLPKTTNVSCMFFSLDNTGNPWVVYDSASVSKIYCKQFNGTAWVSPGGGVVDNYAGFSALTTLPKLHVSANNNAYVSLVKTSGASSYKMYTKIFNGTTWSNFTTTQPPLIGGNLSFQINYFDVDATNKVYSGATPQSYNLPLIYQSTGAAWTLVGNKDVTNGFLQRDVSATIANNGTQYIAGTNGNNQGITTWKYNGTTWDTVGNMNFATGTATRVKTNSSNVPHVLYITGTNLNIKKFNGTNWVNLASAPTVTTGLNGSALDLAFGSNDTVYAAGIKSSYPYVYKFNGTTWQQLGTVPSGTVFTGSGNEVNLEVDNNGTPYIAYVLPSPNYGVGVSSYVNGVWQPLTSFTTSIYGPPSSINIKFDSNNNLYVACTTENSIVNNTKAMVRKYVAGVWQNVGGVYATNAPSPELSMEIDSLNNPWIAFSDGDFPSTSFDINKISIRKFDGTSWSYVGNQAISLSMASDIYLMKNAVNKKMTVAYKLNQSNTVDEVWAKELGTASSVGINELQNNNKNDELTIYPNPISDVLNLVLNDEIQKSATLNMINILGDVVLTQPIYSPSTTINTTNLNSGIYFIIVINGNKKSTQKIIIQ